MLSVCDTPSKLPCLAKLSRYGRVGDVDGDGAPWRLWGIYVGYADARRCPVRAHPELRLAAATQTTPSQAVRTRPVRRPGPVYADPVVFGDLSA